MASKTRKQMALVAAACAALLMAVLFSKRETPQPTDRPLYPLAKLLGRWQLNKVTRDGNTVGGQKHQRITVKSDRSVVLMTAQGKEYRETLDQLMSSMGATQLREGVTVDSDGNVFEKLVFEEFVNSIDTVSADELVLKQREMRYFYHRMDPTD